jgi:hypothetical protein
MKETQAVIGLDIGTTSTKAVQDPARPMPALAVLNHSEPNAWLTLCLLVRTERLSYTLSIYLIIQSD